MDDNANAFSEMAAALNDHEITDQDGQVAEETANEDMAPQETNTVEETATAEKSAESTEEELKDSEVETETQLAEDETGKRYVPEGRFKDVYGKYKATQRELDSFKRQATAQPIMQPTPETSDKAAQLETELLYVTLPQFDPNSDQHDPDLDDLAVSIYQANPGITKIEAGRRAIAKAKALTKDQVKIVAEARTVKTQQSDQGITSRVSNRPAENAEPGAGASLEEMEAYLRKTGEWNSRR